MAAFQNAAHRHTWNAAMFKTAGSCKSRAPGGRFVTGEVADKVSFDPPALALIHAGGKHMDVD